LGYGILSPAARTTVLNSRPRLKCRSPAREVQS
jgi:hypothetical protein